MLLFFIIICYLGLNIISYLCTIKVFRKGEILKGLIYLSLTTALFITFIFLCYLIDFKVNFIIKFLIATLAASKVITLSLRLLLNISRLKQNESYLSRWVIFLPIFIVVAAIYWITDDYIGIPQSTYIYIEAVSYPLFVAGIVQYLQFLERDQKFPFKYK
ncbi:hypothetical protein CQZ94_02820 [Bacillus sp. MYb209]|nr:hypothetical protein CQZ94_02820 [Bacillus sp. MYb209]